MPAICAICSKNINPGRSPGIKCASCDKAFHIKCTDVSDELVKNINSGSASWLCSSCRTTSRRSVIDFSEPPIPMNPAEPTLRDVMAAITSLQNNFGVLETTINYMSESFDALNNQVRLLTDENSALKKKVIQLERNFDVYESKLSRLEYNADIPNQFKIANNIIVCGLPCEAVNMGEIFVNITGLIGGKISPSDITSIVKMNHNKIASNAFKDAFIVSLKTLDIKTTILHNFRKKKSLCLDEVDGYHGKSRILLLHQFTSFQSKIYNEAKKFKTNFNFRYLWCVNNKILLRNRPDSDIHHIRTLSDLDRIKNREPNEDSSGASFYPGTAQPANCINQVQTATGIKE